MNENPDSAGLTALIRKTTPSILVLSFPEALHRAFQHKCTNVCYKTKEQ